MGEISKTGTGPIAHVMSTPLSTVGLCRLLQPFGMLQTTTEYCRYTAPSAYRPLAGWYSVGSRRQRPAVACRGWLSGCTSRCWLSAETCLSCRHRPERLHSRPNETVVGVKDKIKAISSSISYNDCSFSNCTISN